uniref:Uncharacterized protein n=1 Tax=Rhizophora mucronata TaxID=61149 RepID=A0A2P2IKW2_RHIMU
MRETSSPDLMVSPFYTYKLPLQPTPFVLSLANFFCFINYFSQFKYSITMQVKYGDFLLLPLFYVFTPE